MNMQESKHCFSTLNPPNTTRFKGVLQNGAEKGLNPAKCLIFVLQSDIIRLATLPKVHGQEAEEEHAAIYIK